MGFMYAESNRIREQAKIDAARITQKSGNELAGAQTALMQFNQAFSNKRALDAAGERHGMIQETLSRNLDATTKGTLSQRIAASEELGSTAAVASAAGVGGNTMGTINSTLRLANMSDEEAISQGVDTMQLDAARTASASLRDSVAGLDNSVIRADLDYTKYVDLPKVSSFANIVTLGMAAVATVFGGPQAGQAVIGMREASVAADFGDYGAAGAAMSGAVGSAAGAASNAGLFKSFTAKKRG